MKLKQLIKENRGFVLFIVLMVLFRSAIADWNTVPTGSMKPTIIEGDRILVNKLAYDIRIPFTHISLYRFANPQRGDIVVFDSSASGKNMVKRVIGLPGDVVSLQNNHLIVNGEEASYSNLQPYGEQQLSISETLEAMTHTILLNKQASYLRDFQPVTVPEGHYLVLGDNRDNSADSRVYGFIPRDEIMGRSKEVVMSLNYDNYYLPRSDRFFFDLI